MPSFISKVKKATITKDTLLTVPEEKTYLVIGCVVANSDGEKDAEFSLLLRKNATNEEVHLIKNSVSIAGTNSTNLLGKLVLNSEDTLSVIASAENSIEITISYMEM